MPNEKLALNAILRNDFHAFVQKVFETTNGGNLLVDNWHIRAMAWHLEQCLTGDIKRLIINVPPRSLKSLMASVAFPIYCLGHDPGARIICASYSEDLASLFSRQRRDCMKADWFKRTFKGARLSKAKDTEKESITTKGGGCYATSVGGALTGRGANFIIIDDPLKTQEVPSEAERQSANAWYSNTAYTRLDNKSDDVIILVMQRLHEDDLVGHVIDRDDWTVLSLPAIAPEDQEVQMTADETYARKKGAILHREWENRAALTRIKANIGTSNFEAQYQQNPLPPGGNMIKRDWFKRYKSCPSASGFEPVIQSWDTGIETTSDASYSVCITAGWKDERLYVLDVFRDRLEFHELEKEARRRAAKWNPSHILIEKAASGSALIQNLTHHSRLPVISVPPKLDKQTRVASVTGLIEAGRVVLPQEAAWLAEFEHEVLSFPSSKYDDQVDALTHLLRWTQRPGPPEIEGRVLFFGGSDTRDNYYERTGVPIF